MPPPRSPPIAGSATFTTDASRVISAKPSREAARVRAGEAPRGGVGVNWWSEGGDWSAALGDMRPAWRASAAYSSGLNAIRPEVLAMPLHRVAVIAPSPVSMFNLAIPELLFSKVEVAGEPGYELVVCTPEPGPIATTGGLDLSVGRGLDAVEGADTVLVAGTGQRYEPDPRTVAVVARAAAE